MRYFFDTCIRNKTLFDEQGADFETPDAAIYQAKLEAAAYGADRLAHGHEIHEELIIVRAEDDREIARFSICEALTERAQTRFQ